MLGYVVLVTLMTTVMEIGAEVISSTNQQRQEITFSPPLQSKSDRLLPPSSVPSIIDGFESTSVADPLEEHPFKEHYNTDYNTEIKAMRHVPDYFRHEYAPKSKARLNSAVYRCVNSDHVALTYDDGIW